VAHGHDHTLSNGATREGQGAAGLGNSHACPCVV
jgi:hypothetical protein